MKNMIFVSLVLSMLWSALPGQAQTAEIRDTIAGQIDAFQRDDFETAFTYASPSIKRIFGNASNFGRMVREGYPMVFRPAGMSFGGLERISGRTVQTVFFTDASGQVFEAAYDMVETANGWQINGVAIREADLGV